MRMTTKQIYRIDRISVINQIVFNKLGIPRLLSDHLLHLCSMYIYTEEGDKIIFIIYLLFI